ncbi:xanthine dehydrogenase family protein molybdopterin-binding subunit [Desulfobacula phenolica]|uniref:CO or xanthine dehydrogenase, Mo-binding subunit n=1 Tax=Desulfobacula phenolica TaxID=90732 RepID=A0A1H2GSY6_9BACT|nr:molybdopterin cofactor-binding domain-containing protein [Desulfobacula phenolica]SDU22642.1 CO or xanthine dehydrogenase, Mo-binding subunit [Desulfobacula phenolica]
MKYVNKGVEKIDAAALVTGKPVYTDDLAPENCLVVKVLRSPHAFAEILDIDVQKARETEGIDCILTWQDVPGKRFTTAGQSYPEPSPYDRLILDKTVRYVGDPVAIVAGTDEKTVNRALKSIKVSYKQFEPVIDLKQALDNESIIHPEKNYHVNVDIGNDRKRNLCCAGGFEISDVETEFARCDCVVDRVYHTKPNSQAMMETFRTYSYLDHAGRLTLVTSTQIPFHVRRITAKALDIPKAKIRVIKPRIGGGFGAKQTVISELFPAIVTLKTGKPAKMVFDRHESFTASTSRHEMIIRVRAGADRHGNILAIHIDTLSNTGAYGEHAPTTVNLSGHKTMALYNRARAFKFSYQVVYTNTLPAGAFRGYGATQGTFALESAINELADELDMDPLDLRLKNLLRKGDTLSAYYGEPLNSCALEACIKKGREMIGWHTKYPCRKISSTKVRAVGAAITMQGSGIANIDTASAQIRLQDDGFYTLMIGAADMGTGCDTILAQMAAQCLGCPMEQIIVSQVDTDHSPYDTGSYASSTTYLTGTAVVKACEKLKKKIVSRAAALLKTTAETLEFDGNKIFNDQAIITLDDLAQKTAVSNHTSLTAGASHSSPVSPPPFMAGFAEIEMDLETGETKVVDYVGVIDCGTPINPNLARIQAEGGIVQGIGMALYEDIACNTKGKMITSSFMQYKIPSRQDVGKIRVEFESSYEATGPFGAKSIGEVVINTPSPAIAHAIHNAAGIYLRTLPMTCENILMGMLDLEQTKSVDQDIGKP